MARLWLLAAAAWGAAPAETHEAAEDAAPPAEVSGFGARFDGYRFLFARTRIPLGTLEDLERAPDRCLLVVLGPELPGALPDVEPLVERGASVFVATDRPPERPFLGNFQITVVPGPVLAASFLGFGTSAYRGLEHCPILRLADRTSPLSRGVDGIVLNLPGYLRGKNAEAWSLGRITGKLPGGAVVVGTVMTGAEVGQGRLLVLADHSVLINEMLFELDNLRWSQNSIAWLLAGRDPRSVKAVVIEHGVVVDQWIDPRFMSGSWNSLPSYEALLGFLDETVTGLEEEDFFNRWLTQDQERTRPGPAWRTGALVASLVLFALLAGWLLSMRPSPPQSRDKGGAALPGGSPLDQRRQAVLASGNFADPGARLARQFFSHTLASDQWKTQMPRPVVTGGLVRRWRVTRALRRIWKLAAGTDRRRVGRRQFRRVQEDLALLERHVRNGSLALV